MENPAREHRAVDWSWRTRVARPRAQVERITVQVPGMRPADALIARPDHPTGVTAHFVGFNIPMSPWEQAKAALFADASNTVVVMSELPGFSRHTGRLPDTTRHDLTRGNPRSLAEATWAVLSDVLRVADVPDHDGRLDIMGYSTGCSLAVAAMPIIQAHHEVTRLTLIEPVSLLRRSIPRLALDNTADLIGLTLAVPGDLSTPWIRAVAKAAATDPGVHFSRPDFLALVAMLAGDDTMVRLEQSTRPGQPHPWPTTDLVRGGLSRLTDASAFTSLDADLAERGVGGTTCLVPRIGHQLWQSIPAVASLADALSRHRHGAGADGSQAVVTTA